MCSNTLDLSNLREAIGNDKELELELLEEFTTSSNALLNSLQNHCDGQSDNEQWRQDMHAIKGLCYNLGAAKLGELCSEGQGIFEQDCETKKQLLDQAKSEYAEIEMALNVERN